MNIVKKLFLSALVISAASAVAAPIVYEGALINGVTSSGSLAVGSSHSDPDAVDYWSFTGNVGDVLTIEVSRIETELDPAMWIFDGLFADTLIFGGTIDTGDAGFVDFADDEIPHVGPWGDPLSVFSVELTHSGTFTAMIGDFASGATNLSELSYEITLDGSTASVPENGATLALLGASLVGLVSLRRRMR